METELQEWKSGGIAEVPRVQGSKLLRQRSMPKCQGSDQEGVNGSSYQNGTGVISEYLELLERQQGIQNRSQGGLEMVWSEG